jgi:outer membrane protein
VATAHAEPARLDLDTLIQRAQGGDRARMAHADRAQAAARVGEADAARWARITGTGFVAPSPHIECVDPSCTATDPSGFALDFEGVFAGGRLELIQPLYTFGKLAAVRDAARSGLVAQDALTAAAAGDLALDAARAYWGLKLARELRWMLEDGDEEISDAITRIEQRLADGDTDVSIQDRQRVELLLAEARIQLAEARQGEAQALAAVRALAGDDTADIDEEPLEAVGFTLAPDEHPALTAAHRDRPEVQAARAGADAARRLADLETRGYLPDLALVGSVGYARARGVDDAPSAYFNDPYNGASGSLALVLRWTVEPLATRAKVARARAAHHRAEALADLAVTGATLDVRSARADAAGAQDKLAAATRGEQAAKTWLASVLQADAIGTGEAKDLADAYIGWFQMRARLVAAIFQWNVAIMRLRRAGGEFSLDRVRR